MGDFQRTTEDVVLVFRLCLNCSNENTVVFSKVEGELDEELPSRYLEESTRRKLQTDMEDKQRLLEEKQQKSFQDYQCV